MRSASLEREEFIRVRLEEPEACEGYEILDAVGRNVGRAEKVFVNDHAEVEHVQVKTGLLGWKPLLLPVEMLSIDDEKRTLSLR